MKREEEFLLFDLLPALEKISMTFHSHPEISAIASDLQAKITSRDPSWVEGNEVSKPSTEKRPDIKDILKDLNDPLIPVRAYALVSLRQV